MFLIPIGIIFLALASYLLYKKLRPQMLRKRLLSNHSDQLPDFIDCLKQSHWETNHLKEEDLKTICEHALTLSLEKTWGKGMTRESILKESIQASLPLLSRKTNLYPSVTHIESTKPFSFWLHFHELQFSSERSGIDLKELNGDFTTLSELYFKDHNALKRESSKLFIILDSYFQFY
jgi:hypothetical protein